MLDANRTKAHALLQATEHALELAKLNKPSDRSSEDRYYAMLITDLEHTVAFIAHWIVSPLIFYDNPPKTIDKPAPIP